LTETLKRARRLHIFAAFASIYTIWGSTYLAIRYAVETIPPFLMLGTRFVVSGAILYAWARQRKSPNPTRRQWKNGAIAGFFLLVCGNGAVGWAEQSMASGITALLVSVLPFWLVFIDWVRPKGRAPRPLVIAGLVLGVIGIFVLVDPMGAAGSNGVSKLGASVLMLGSLSWAIGSFYSRDADLPASGIMRTAVEMLGGGILLLSLGLIAGEARDLDLHLISRASVLGLVYLTTFGSLIGFTAYIWLLDKVSPAMVGTYAFVNPVVAVFLGWGFAGEPLSARTLVAAAIVIGAVALITISRGEPAADPECA
jgi:Permeases of the drug/metabolite transporter (DMT) superfamily